MAALMIGMEETRSPGRIDRVVSIAESSAGNPIVVPVITIEGERPGKTLWIQAGVHGDEYTGIGAIAKLQSLLEPDKLAGRLILVPALHAAAVDAMQRFSPIDGIDLANTYPGRSDGFVTERIAAWTISQMTAYAEVVIDLHTSEPWGDACGYVNAALATARTAQDSLNLAKVFGFPWIVQTDFVREERLLRPTLDNRGIVAISVELGGLGIWTEENVTWLLEGLTNVMKYLGMLRGEPVSPRHPQRVLSNSTWIHTNSGGLFHTHSRIGDLVQPGETIGVVCDFFGKTKEVIRVPDGSVVLIQRLRPVVRSGDEVALIGKLG